METKLYKCSLKNEDKIGRGSYGTVYKGHQKNNNRTPVAIKRIENDGNDVTGNAMKDFKAMLAVCGHENIVQLLELDVQPHFIFIIMEYCNKGDLDSCLSQGVPSYRVKLDIMRQCAAGVAYIHGLSPPVVHRDLKPQNILLHRSRNGVLWVKLCDFGLAKVFEDMTGSIGGMYMKTAGGTMAFMAPEIWMSKHYTAMIDTYALGLIFAIIVNHSDIDNERVPLVAGVARPYFPFGQRQLQADSDKRPLPSLHFTTQFAENHPRMKSLIVQMTSFEAKKRTKMQKIESEINREISDQHEELAGPRPATGAGPKQYQQIKPKTSEASSVGMVRARQQPIVDASANSVFHIDSYRKTDRRLRSIRKLTPNNRRRFKIRNDSRQMCYHQNMFLFPCQYGSIDCYSMEGIFIRSISLSPHLVGRLWSVHPLTGDCLLVAAQTGLYKLDTGEGGKCRHLLPGWCNDVHVSEGLVAILVKGVQGECDRVHILQAAVISPPGRIITLADGDASRVLLYQNSLCVSSGWTDGHQHTIRVYSLSTGEQIYQYGQEGNGVAGELSWPNLCVCDREGTLLVVDYHNHRLQMLSDPGEWAVLPGLGEVGKPWDAVIVGDRMLVLDHDQNVHAFRITYETNFNIQSFLCCSTSR